MSPDRTHNSGDGFENALLSGNFFGMFARALPFVGDAGVERAFFALFTVLYILHSALRKLSGSVCAYRCVLC